MLPGIQVALAAFLLGVAGPHRVPVPTPRLVCSGLNAPAALLAGVLEASRLSPAVLPLLVHGVEISDLYLLAGTALAWYFVGRAMERRALVPVGRPKATRMSGLISRH